MSQVTMKHVAQIAGVSQQTVSRIINHKDSLVTEKTRERVLKITRDLNYQPNHFAQSLKTGRTNLIGVATMGSLFGNFDNRYASQVYHGISEYLASHNYQLVFQNAQEIASGPVYLKLAESNLVDGIIFLLYSFQVDLFEKEMVPLLTDKGIPHVGIHSLREKSNFTMVGLDCVAGGILAGEHLIKCGYTSLGCVCIREYRHQNDLFLGFKSACEDNHVELPEHFIYEPESPNAWTGYALAEEMLASGQPLPRALFVAEDEVALGMMKKFREVGLRVPEDMAIVGFGTDEQQKFSLHELTSVGQPSMQKGKRAAELLLDQVEGNGPREIRQTIFKPELVVRKSCGFSQHIGD